MSAEYRPPTSEHFDTEIVADGLVLHDNSDGYTTWSGTSVLAPLLTSVIAPPHSLGLGEAGRVMDEFRRVVTFQDRQRPFIPRGVASRTAVILASGVLV